MRKSIPGFLTVFLVAAVVASPAVSQNTASPIDDPQVAAAIAVFDVWVQYTVRQKEQPGLSVGLVYDQDLIWSKGYGYADLERKIPAAPSTAYRIASITKLFTATAILQLRDAGKLQLDDPVAKHLSWFVIKDAYESSPVITIRHVLTHTSGLPRELEELYWDHMKFPDRDAFAEMLHESSTILPRESEYKYSNVAFAVLGHVVESVSGQPYDEYVTKNILQPLEMTATEVLPEPDMPALATGYEARKPGQPRPVEPFTDVAAMASAASMASTVEDLAKFLSLQFRDEPAGGNQILKGSTLREMQRVQWLQPDWKSGRGLGWRVSRHGDQVRIGHGGYVPGHITHVSASPAEKFGVIVLTNAADGSVGTYAGKAWDIVAPAIKEVTTAPEEAPLTDSAWVRYVGEYEWFDGFTLRAMILHDGLALVDPSVENPWKDRIRLEPVSDGVFRMKDQWQKGELIRFEVDDSGTVTRLVMPGYSLVKL